MRRTKLAAAGLAGLTGVAMLITGPAPSNANPQGTNVVISQIQSRAANVSPTIANAAELYNPTTSPIPIDNWVLNFYNSNNTIVANQTFDPGTEVPALGHIVVKDPNFLPTPMEPSMAQLPGRIFNYTLVSGTDGLPDAGGVALLDNSGVKVDGVATDVGASTALEGSPAEALAATTDSLNASIRRDVNGDDNDDNDDDFSRRPAGWGAQIG